MPITFADMKARYNWKAIAICPGRFILQDVDASFSLKDLLGPTIKARELKVDNARDTVLLVQFREGGGIISYRRPDGSYLHTLNTADGLQKKLVELEITL